MHAATDDTSPALQALAAELEMSPHSLSSFEELPNSSLAALTSAIQKTRAATAAKAEQELSRAFPRPLRRLLERPGR